MSGEVLTFGTIENDLILITDQQYFSEFKSLIQIQSIGRSDLPDQINDLDHSLIGIWLIFSQKELIMIWLIFFMI